MARQQAAGSMIVDQLRDRIVSGLYLGRWAPGERLPSIRDVADAENVDRKTAAAAYRRLQMEGLVRVRPRSGVYLRGSEPERSGGPLERLHRRWLENAYEGARAIGLDTPTMLKLIQAVALIEKQRIPVLEHDAAQAEAIALEISERLGVNAVPVQLQGIDPSEPRLATAPFLVTTPYHGGTVRRIAGGRQVVEVSCAREVVEELRLHATSGRLLIVAPTSDAAERLQRAIEHGEVVAQDLAANVRVEHGVEAARDAARDADAVLIWPGTPRAVEHELREHDPITPGRCVADESVVRVRSAVLDSAMRAIAAASVNTTNGDATRQKTVVL